MKFKFLVVLGMIIFAITIVSAQTAKRTITNFDLEKYRIRRERAEADYRENYAKRGMPSPEELQRREEENTRQREELSRRLTAERQLNEQYQLQVQIAQQNARVNLLNDINRNLANQINNQPVYRNYPWLNVYPVYGGYYGYPRPYRQFYPRFGTNEQSGPAVVAGGGMVYTVPRAF